MNKKQKEIIRLVRDEIKKDLKETSLKYDKLINLIGRDKVKNDKFYSQEDNNHQRMFLDLRCGIVQLVNALIKN